MEKCAYKKTVEKARGKIGKREYWQTEDISWLSRKKEWAGLKSIILTRNTIKGAGGKEIVEERYFISSLPTGIEEIARAVRGALDGGELSLAFGRDIPGRREPYIRETGIL